MEENDKRFLEKIQEIRLLGPGYRLGHCGDDGWCDCIGLVIGALKRCGITWTQATRSGAIHGSNWAARYALDTPLPQAFSRAGELAAGDLVFKTKAPGQSGYALPGKYREGKAHDCGSYLDYMHVGVVTGVEPLRITHCASGGVKVDGTVGKWSCRGRLRALSSGTQAAPVPAAAARPTLRNGSRGEQVTLLQRLLNAQGAALAEDGIFGRLTGQAVRQYQRTWGLAVDGVVGPMTWRVLTGEAAA